MLFEDAFLGLLHLVYVEADELLAIFLVDHEATELQVRELASLDDEPNEISHVGGRAAIHTPQDEVLLVMISNVDLICQNLGQDNDLLITLGWVR